MSQGLKERNHGIDLLKILSMFMVVIIHIFGHGEILYNTPTGSATYWTAWFLEVCVFCCVNCFALTTGYLMVGRPFKYRKIIPLWVTVFFYNLVLFGAGILFFPSSVNIDQIFYLTPAISKEYWYFTAYFILFFFIPFLNKLIEALTKKEFYILLLTGFLLLSGIHIASVLKADAANLNKGYSAWWMMYLYLLGAGVKKYGLFTKMSAGMALLGYIASVSITFLTSFSATYLRNNNVPFFTYVIKIYGTDRFIEYISPTVLASAVFLMIFCLKLKIPKCFNGILAFLSPLVFQVYLIHEHPVIRSNFVTGKFSYLASRSPIGLALGVLVSAACIFIICIAIDSVRFYLFKLLRVNKNINIIADKIKNKFATKTPSQQ